MGARTGVAARMTSTGELYLRLLNTTTSAATATALRALRLRRSDVHSGLTAAVEGERKIFQY